MIRPRAILINISGRNQRQKKSVFCSDPIALLYSRCATSRQNADACLWAMQQSVVSSSGKIERRKQTVCVSGRVCSTIHSIHLHVQYSQISLSGEQVRVDRSPLCGFRVNIPTVAITTLASLTENSGSIGLHRGLCCRKMSVRPSDRPSVRLSVCLTLTLTMLGQNSERRNSDHRNIALLPVVW